MTAPVGPMTMTVEREASDREQFAHCGEACRHSPLRRAWAEIDALRALVERQREVIAAGSVLREAITQGLLQLRCIGPTHCMSHPVLSTSHSANCSHDAGQDMRAAVLTYDAARAAMETP